MTRLTDKEYWEGVYQGAKPDIRPTAGRGRLKQFLRALMGRRLRDMLAPYDDYLLWQVVFPRYLPLDCHSLSIVEIGSAPGNFLVQFSQRFGAQPFGVEYTSQGAARNRETFKSHGIAESHVIEADFFSDEFLSENKGRFDIVISRGFIEHFVDVDTVVLRHTELLKEGGLLFILIPNLRGIYLPWTKVFNPEQVPLHNLELMKLSNFRKAFESSPLEVLRCGYFGTFSFWLFTATSSARFANKVISFLHIVQRGLNLLFRLIFGARGCESAILSPNLIFVGRKK